jgi:hypothetical protein
MGVMKTTIEISESLLRKAKTLAKERGITLRAFIEESLQRSLSNPGAASGFHLRDCSVGGDGPKRAFADEDWATWRAAAYGDRE